MTYNELLEELAQRLNWTQQKTEEALQATVSIVKDDLSEGCEVSIKNFGTFGAIKEDEYIIEKPDSEESYLVPPVVKVVFKPSLSIKQLFQNLEK